MKYLHIIANTLVITLLSGYNKMISVALYVCKAKEENTLSVSET
mgnify:FL=1